MNSNEKRFCIKFDRFVVFNGKRFVVLVLVAMATRVVGSGEFMAQVLGFLDGLCFVVLVLLTFPRVMRRLLESLVTLDPRL